MGRLLIQCITLYALRLHPACGFGKKIIASTFTDSAIRRHLEASK